MNAGILNERDKFLENLAAELTYAAYPVMLRHGVGDKWLELELDLWKALTESVKRLDRAGLSSLVEALKAPELLG